MWGFPLPVAGRVASPLSAPVLGRLGEVCDPTHAAGERTLRILAAVRISCHPGDDARAESRFDRCAVADKRLNQLKEERECEARAERCSQRRCC